MDELTALIVNEYPDSLAAWEYSLSQRGLHVLTASDGSEAVMKAATELPDVVLLDLDLPAQEAFEVARLLHELPQTRDVPVVAMTGQTDRRLVEQARISGMRAVFIKPCHPDSLVLELERLCGAEAARRAGGRDRLPPYLLVERAEPLHAWPFDHPAP
jgi:CheY-like chemotaxis protein